MGRGWWMWIERGNRENTKDTIASCELPGGESDAGLMEGDLMYLFSVLIENAHPDLTRGEISRCYRQAMTNKVSPTASGNAIVIGQKRRMK